MKKGLAAAFLAASVLALSACSSTDSGSTYKDGTYTANGDEFSDGWKEYVTITISDGKISDVEWSAENEDSSIPDKKTYAAEGNYGMLAAGAQSEWNEQAEAMEDELIRTQDPAKIKVTDGYADEVSGATISVSSFIELSEKALEQAK